MFFIDPYYSKKTSGSRFFIFLEKQLSSYKGFSKTNYSNVLINISSPLKRFIIYRLKNKRIVIRVDGKYNYPISKNSLKYAYPIASGFLIFTCRYDFVKTILRKFSNSKKLLFLFNLKFNYSILIKIFLSSHIIYQSSYSKDLYKNIFPKKKHTIINNFTPWVIEELPSFKLNRKVSSNQVIKLCTNFNSNRPLKGLGDLLNQLNVIRSDHPELGIKLFLFGCSKNEFIKTFSKVLINFDQFIEENNDWIITFPQYNKFDVKLSRELISCDAFITFSQYDTCPNIILEALSHNLPIIACKSGGIPEIVKNCGILLPVKNSIPINDLNLNLEYGVQPPNIKNVYDAIIKIKSSSEKYRKNIQESILKTLSSRYGCDKYHKIVDI